MTEPASDGKTKGSGCLSKVRWTALTVFLIVVPVYIVDSLHDLYTLYRNQGREFAFGPLCVDGAHAYIGRVLPDELTPEARALLLQWPKKLWPIGYYLKIDRSQIHAKGFVYFVFLDELLKQTGKDAAELYRIAGRQPPEGSRPDSWGCGHYVRIGTEKGFTTGHAPSRTYAEIMPIDMHYGGPWWVIELFLGENVEVFKRLLFEKNIDPFTRQPLPPPPPDEGPARPAP